MANYSGTNYKKDEKKVFFEYHGQYYLRWATYFVQMKDAIGICGLLNIQNCIGALKCYCMACLYIRLMNIVKWIRTLQYWRL